MKRVFDKNLVYLQDDYEFNIYYLNPIDGEFMYQLSITKTDDYNISLEVNHELMGHGNKQEFAIDKSNLFYPAFSTFLTDQERVTIKDDLGYNKYGKQVTVSVEEENIKLSFQYEKEDNLNEYGVHIINVAYDGRSLIDQQGQNTKERLFKLCDILLDTFNQFEEKYDGPRLQKVKK